MDEGSPQALATAEPAYSLGVSLNRCWRTQTAYHLSVRGDILYLMRNQNRIQECWSAAGQSVDGKQMFVEGNLYAVLRQ